MSGSMYRVMSSTTQSENSIIEHWQTLYRSITTFINYEQIRGYFFNMITILSFVCVVFFFFFQAEDGIRDYKVTGVQTCALPIFSHSHSSGWSASSSPCGLGTPSWAGRWRS